jgi:hypothetical protein
LTTQRDSFLQEVQGIRSELDRLLEGLDYSFDWKPTDEEWSAREIVYHLVDTPSDGIHTTIQGVLGGSVQEIPITAGLTNLTDERSGKDLAGAKGDLEGVLSGMERTLNSATDADLTGKSAVLHSFMRGTREDWSAERLVAGIFVRHWREHLEQLAALREALGLE